MRRGVLRPAGPWHVPGCGGTLASTCGLLHAPRCRLLVAAAQSLSDLAQAAARAFSSGTAPPWLAPHVVAGCGAVMGCSRLADAAELSAAAAFKVAAACSLVFGPGEALLDMHLQPGMSSATAAAAAAQLSSRCRIQLEAVASVFHMLHALHRRKAAAAFAGSTGKPATLLPWLFKVSQALPAAGIAAADTGK